MYSHLTWINELELNEVHLKYSLKLEHLKRPSTYELIKVEHLRKNIRMI